MSFEGFLSDPIHKFQYWPRYVCRLIRMRPVYRKELLGWRFQTDHMYQTGDSLPNESREEKFLPVWHFSEKAPWNIANRLSEFPYPNLTWCVIHEDGRKEARKLRPLPPEDQLIFKGDRVRVLVGPHKGRTGIVSSVLKMRRLVYVDGLNYRITKSPYQNNLKLSEDPLDMDTEVALLDPSNNEPCKCAWRYTDDGDRVRVSLYSGHIIPLPNTSHILDDLTDPKTTVDGPKDTSESSVSNKTVLTDSDMRFDVSVSKHLGLEHSPAEPTPTYWH
ncbi:unnamed protein product [Trichobilharzia szidati]|nr:unnamed protein product [Trichobilharzia szidati]